MVLGSIGTIPPVFIISALALYKLGEWFGWRIKNLMKQGLFIRPKALWLTRKAITGTLF